MHSQTLDSWRHNHVFLGVQHKRNEWRTWIVVALTAGMMIAEIIAGYLFGSMALLADGFHMATHAGALTMAGFAYYFARRHAHDARLTFGTGKLGELAGYTSAVILALIALMIGVQSIVRLATPVDIKFSEATLVAVIGLIVNLASAWLLHSGEHSHEHGHDDHEGGAHGAAHHHHDHNLRSAYLHVLTDALTSVLAIVALLAGSFFGWVWMDPLMGIVGAVVIARWSWGLLTGAGAILLDAVPDDRLASSIRERIEINGDKTADLHLWRLGPGHLAVIVSVVSHAPQPPGHYKRLLAGLPSLSHITIEVHACVKDSKEESCVA